MATITKKQQQKQAILISKVVEFDSGRGIDQLKNVVGKPQAGDVVKLHAKCKFVARRPLIPSTSLFKKEREIEFLDTTMIGDTAFLELTMTDKQSTLESVTPTYNPCDDLLQLVTKAASTMKLGEKAKFTFDVMELNVHRLIATGQICRGHYKNIGEDATKLILEMDSFRIVREGTEHRRPNRYGNGATYIGRNAPMPT